MWSRRTVLSGAAALGVARWAEAKPPTVPVADEDETALWREVQLSFDTDRTIVNFNHGGCCPTPRVVHDAYLRYLNLANQLPTRILWTELEPGIETVRRELGGEAGVDPETVAITRNASEALQIAQLGLTLQRDDEVVVCEHDYPRMRDTWDQRARRDGIRVVEVGFDVMASDDEVIAAYVGATTPKTRVWHITHATHLSGKVLPAAELCRMARERGITSIVDGAHGFAHLPIRAGALGADFYGTSLHKWLLAPTGTGMLLVRRDRIAGHWPLMAAHPTRTEDVRKFEEIGTHPAAAHNAVAEALAFHQRIGLERKHRRLHALRMRWHEAMRGVPGVRLLTSEDPTRSGGIGVIQIGQDGPGDQVAKLWANWRIWTTAIDHPRVRGLRITPNVGTSEHEIDVLVSALRSLATA